MFAWFIYCNEQLIMYKYGIYSQINLTNVKYNYYIILYNRIHTETICKQNY